MNKLTHNNTSHGDTKLNPDKILGRWSRPLACGFVLSGIGLVLLAVLAARWIDSHVLGPGGGRLWETVLLGGAGGTLTAGGFALMVAGSEPFDDLPDRLSDDPAGTTPTA